MRQLPLLLGLTLAAMPAMAAQQELSRPQLCAHAGRVAIAEIATIDHGHDGKGGFDRVLTAKVQQTVKGTAQSEILFTLRGGSIGDDWLWNPDEPNLLTGATYLLFLTTDDTAAYVLGGEQGAVRIVSDGGRGETLTQALETLGGCDAK
jgi:hypothetical protein